MSKNKKKKKLKNTFGSDLNYNGGSNKVSKRLRKQFGGLTPSELSYLYSKIQLTDNKITVLSTKTYN